MNIKLNDKVIFDTRSFGLVKGTVTREVFQYRSELSRGPYKPSAVRHVPAIEITGDDGFVYEAVSPEHVTEIN